VVLTFCAVWAIVTGYTETIPFVKPRFTIADSVLCWFAGGTLYFMSCKTMTVRVLHSDIKIILVQLYKWQISSVFWYFTHPFHHNYYMEYKMPMYLKCSCKNHSYTSHTHVLFCNILQNNKIKYLFQRGRGPSFVCFTVVLLLLLFKPVGGISAYLLNIFHLSWVLLCFGIGIGRL